MGDATSGNRTLSKIALAIERRRPERCDDGADQPADEGVARGRRDPEPPRDQVPGDRADERRGHDDLTLVAGRASSRCPEAIVLATAVPVSAPTKFAVADMRMACVGRSARVDTEVAIAFAVSWKPLM